jgi:hypothetical protein
MTILYLILKIIWPWNGLVSFRVFGMALAIDVIDESWFMKFPTFIFPPFIREM